MRIYHTSEVSGQYEPLAYLYMELAKWQLMWQLRSLEDKINADSNGVITIKGGTVFNGIDSVEVAGFGPELLKEITALLKDFHFCKQ